MKIECKIKIFIVFLCFYSNWACSASLEETVIGGAASSIMCESYADQLGRDGGVFREINIQTLKLAEELGYTDDFQVYKDTIWTVRTTLQKELLKKYRSKAEIYDDWCYRFYINFKNGVQKEIAGTEDQPENNENIECIAIYSGLSVGMEKTERYALAQRVREAAKKRADISAKLLGREEARQHVHAETKTIRKKYTDQEFNSLSRKCLASDGIEI